MLYVEMETILVRTPPNPRGPSGFDAFLRIAERGTPFTALGGRAFISVPAQFSSGYLTLPIRSRAFRQRFFDQYFAECDTIPTTHAFTALLHHLQAPAPEQPNGKPSHPTLDTLRSTLNLGAPSSPGWLRCLAWLLAALRTHGPYPILILRGPSGCGKSLAARILRSIIDPSAAPFTPLPSSSRRLLTLARLNWVLAFDHVSTLTPQIADTFCRLTSGVGVPCRARALRLAPLRAYRRSRFRHPRSPQVALPPRGLRLCALQRSRRRPRRLPAWRPIRPGHRPGT